MQKGSGTVRDRHDGDDNTLIVEDLRILREAMREQRERLSQTIQARNTTFEELDRHWEAALPADGHR